MPKGVRRLSIATHKSPKDSETVVQNHVNKAMDKSPGPNRSPAINRMKRISEKVGFPKFVKMGSVNSYKY